MVDIIKPWYQSRSVWFGILTIVAAIAADLAGYLTNTSTTVISAWGIIGIILRSITKTPITWT